MIALGTTNKNEELNSTSRQGHCWEVGRQS